MRGRSKVAPDLETQEAFLEPFREALESYGEALDEVLDGLVELDRLDAAPEAAEGEPGRAVDIEGDVGIDGVVVIVLPRLIGAEDRAVVGPAARVQSGARGATREEHIVHQNHGLILDVERDGGLRRGLHRGRILQVVTMRRDIYSTHRRLHLLDAHDSVRQALGNGEAAALHADQHQSFDAVVALDNFVC